MISMAARSSLRPESWEDLYDFLDPQRGERPEADRDDVAESRCVEIRRKLACFFAARGCPDADDLAIDTLLRVAGKCRQVDRSGYADCTGYFYGVARNVLHEWQRRASADVEGRESLRAEIERRLFSDDEVFWERLSIAEDELLDDDATGALDADDRVLFASHFLSTGERRARLEFARAIHAYARRREPDRLGAWDWLRSSSPVPRWAMAAAALLVLTLLPAALWRMAPGDATPAVASVSLSPGLLRGVGGGVARVHLSDGCEVLHLDLLTSADAYATYSATLHEVSGEPIWSQHKLSGAARDGGVSVRLTLPCGLLPENDYWTRLTGVAPGQEPASLDRYDFRLLRE